MGDSKQLVAIERIENTILKDRFHGKRKTRSLCGEIKKGMVRRGLGLCNLSATSPILDKKTGFSRYYSLKLFIVR